MAKVLVSESKACGVLLAALSLVTASFIPEPMVQYFPWIFVKTRASLYLFCSRAGILRFLIILSYRAS